MNVSREWKSLSGTQREILSRYHNDFPVPVGAIAKEFGIRVVKSTMPGSISGEIRDVDGCVTIKVNRHDVKERQRFTIAHEIAHFLLHRDRLENGIKDDVLYRSRLSDELELEANRLAADIIMPYSLINKYLPQFSKLKAEERYAKIADKAQVSLAALKVRMGKWSS